MVARGRGRGRGEAKKSIPSSGAPEQGSAADIPDVYPEGSAGGEQGPAEDTGDAAEGLETQRAESEKKMEGVEEHEQSFEGETKGMGTSENQESLDMEQFTEIDFLPAQDTDLSLEATESQFEDLELAGDGADDDDGYPANQAGTDEEDENDVVNDISWVEELWNLKKAEEAKAENVPAAGEEQQMSDINADHEMKDDSEIKEKSEEAGNESGEVENCGEDQEKVTPEQVAEKTPPLRRKAFPDTALSFTKRNTCIPPAYFGPAFEESSFQCCVRISPVSYMDLTGHDFKLLLQKVGYLRIQLCRGTPRCLELFCQRVQPLLPDLLFCTFTMNYVTIEMERRSPTGWTKVNRGEKVMSVPTGFTPEVATKVSYRVKNSYFRKVIKKITTVNTHQSVKERSLFINNLPPNVDKGVLKLIFPLALKIAVMKVSENLSSAVLTMHTRRMVFDYLVSVTNVRVNGQLLDLGGVNITQEAALERMKKPNARLRNQLARMKANERKEFKGSKGKSDVKDDKTESSAGDSQKLSREEQAKRQKEKTEKERNAREQKEKERLEREKKDMEQRERRQREKEREREKVQRERVDREKSTQRAQDDAKLKKREPTKKEVPGLGVERDRKRERQLRPGQQRAADFRFRRQQQMGQWREMEMHHGMEMYRNMEMQHEIEMQREIQREMEMQREMQREEELRRQMEMREMELQQKMEQERKLQQEREWREEQRKREEMERQKRERMRQEEEELQRRHQQELMQEREQLQKMREDANRKLQMVEKERQRDREELQRQEREMEMERQRMQQQLEEERRRLQQERKEEQERLSRKRGRYEEPMELAGMKEDFRGGSNKRGRGEQGALSQWGRFDPPSAAAGSSSGEPSVKRKLELEVARQAEELKKSLALLDKIKDPSGLSTSLGEAHSGKGGKRGAHHSAAYERSQPQQSGYEQPYDQNQGYEYDAQQFQNYEDLTYFQHPTEEDYKKTERRQEDDYAGWYGEPQNQKWPQSSKAAWGLGAGGDWGGSWSSQATSSQSGKGGSYGGLGQGERRGGGGYGQKGANSYGQKGAGSYGQKGRGSRGNSGGRRGGRGGGQNRTGYY